MPSVINGSDNFSTSGVNATSYVLNATAGASVGAVGTYAWLVENTANSTNIAFGATFSGAELRTNGVYMTSTEGGTVVSSGRLSTPSGTWRAMGSVEKFGSSRHGATIFLRIS